MLKLCKTNDLSCVVSGKLKIDFRTLCYTKNILIKDNFIVFPFIFNTDFQYKNNYFNHLQYW